MKIFKVNNTPPPTVLEEINRLWKSGGMVVYPTETCYGMGVDATNEAAVKKLLEYKGGRQNKAISVAVANQQMAAVLVEINETANNLYKNFLPGPVTVISKSKGKVVPVLESVRGNLGIRWPDHPIALALIRLFGKPITATSANTSGQKQPYSLEDLQRYTSKKKLNMIDGFVDVGRLPKRETSTVVDTTLNELEVIRQGRIDLGGKANQLVTRSAEETRRFGLRLIQDNVEKLSTKPLVVALQGELGAGKTQVVKGMAQALGITTTVASPTYQIMKEYEYRCGKLSGKLVHIDTWRLEEGEELMELGLREMPVSGNVVAIEWLEKVKEMIDQWKNRAEIIWVTIETVDPETRRIKWRR